MAIKIKVQKSAPPPPAVVIGHLKRTARKLAELILEHADYEFEGFTWLSSTFGGIASQLGVNEKTIARNAQKPPFHYIHRQTSEDGKHILLKLGTEPCETDHMYRLRAVWVRGLAHFNEAAMQIWPTDAIRAKHAGKPHKRLLKRIEDAQKWAPALEKLKAGKRISYNVQPHEMGLLRQCVKKLGDDAFPTIACLTSWNGWHKFISYTKIADRIEDKYYHWPTLGPIAGNPDIALQAYLDIVQEGGKIDLIESTRLNAKIATLEPQSTP
ncbi:hypothetical protein [Sphingomonas quercus]|uniref:Uncharacterized protein n=1 Tax=Sphingomonas quercus TaxID=2842451 RepID=A0ABS6BKM8_9SPHN|nr:hypothetical protein [Sphingomonas quercus]MBU3077814.1 hypothetical protein [Sphingomonas quercus]